MNYNDVLNSIVGRMGSISTISKSAPAPTPTQTITNDLLNKIGLEVQRQGGTR